VAFTATGSAGTPGTGTPTGTVTFQDGATPLGTATLSGGMATFTISSLGAGSHSLTATYGGAGNFAGSTSAALLQVVNLPGTSVAVVSSVNASVVGQASTFTATVSPVSPGRGIPSGTLTL